MSKFDAETVDRLQSTAMERLLTPKKMHLNNKFSQLCTFSPKVGRPKSAKGIERLNTPFHERLYDKTTNVEREERALEEADRLLTTERGATFLPVNSKDSWDMMYRNKQ